MMLILLGLLPLGLLANGIPYCVEGTLADYMQLQQGCIIDDKLFSNWAYVATGSYGGTPPPASGVEVVPLTTYLNPGFLFRADWFAQDGQVIESYIRYTVSVLPGGFPINDLSLEIAGHDRRGNAGVVVWETTNPNIGSLSVYNTQEDVKVSDLILVTPTMGPVQVDNHIRVYSKGKGKQDARVSEVYNRFSESYIPEPITMVLIGSGLLGLGLLRRHSHRA